MGGECLQVKETQMIGLQKLLNHFLPACHGFYDLPWATSTLPWCLTGSRLPEGQVGTKPLL